MKSLEEKRIRKEELEIDTYTTVLDKSEFTPCSCFFKSNRTYNWRVKSCCDKNGEICGDWKEWIFTTNPAPEPRLPYDLDWNSPDTTTNVPKEEIDKLKWCEIDDSELYRERKFNEKTWYSPISYNFRIYYYDPNSNQEECHPNALRGGDCYKRLQPDQTERPFYPFEFYDKDHLYLTKVTPYAWQVAACREEGETGCTDYSQLWRFEAENFTLDKPVAVFPPDDKEKPIGIPVVISWSSPYAFSWKVEIKDESTGQIILSEKTSVSKINLDIPPLELNKLYSWQIKPCWDYQANYCENFWSEKYYFKTGTPPRLLYPSPDETDVLIPVNFDWQDVSGAGSYLFKIH